MNREERNIHVKVYVNQYNYLLNKLNELTDKRLSLIKIIDDFYQFIVEYHKTPEKIKYATIHSIFFIKMKADLKSNKIERKIYINLLTDAKRKSKQIQRYN